MARSSAPSSKTPSSSPATDLRWTRLRVRRPDRHLPSIVTGGDVCRSGCAALEERACGRLENARWHPPDVRFLAIAGGQDPASVGAQHGREWSPQEPAAEVVEPGDRALPAGGDPYALKSGPHREVRGAAGWRVGELLRRRAPTDHDRLPAVERPAQDRAVLGTSSNRVCVNESGGPDREARHAKGCLSVGAHQRLPQCLNSFRRRRAGVSRERGLQAAAPVGVELGDRVRREPP